MTERTATLSAEGLQSVWFQLCWQSPDEFSEPVEQLRWSEVYALWQRFLDAEDAALPTEEFPAWLLLKERQPTLFTCLLKRLDR